jgi:hypothetical protein
MRGGNKESIDNFRAYGAIKGIKMGQALKQFSNGNLKLF